MGCTLIFQPIRTRECSPNTIVSAMEKSFFSFINLFFFLLSYFPLSFFLFFFYHKSTSSTTMIELTKPHILLSRLFYPRNHPPTRNGRGIPPRNPCALPAVKTPRGLAQKQLVLHWGFRNIYFLIFTFIPIAIPISGLVSSH